MSDLLAFAQERPAEVNPVYPGYQRPSFNLAPVIDTANKFGMAQRDMAAADLSNNFNAKANPLKLKGLETDVKNALDQASANQKYEALSKIQAADTAAQYVMSQPEAERVSAWNAAADTMAQQGIMSADEAAKWKAVPPAEYAAHANIAKETRAITEAHMSAYGGKTGTASQDLQARLAAERQLQSEITQNTDLAGDKAAQDARFNEIYQRLIGKSSSQPAAEAPAPAPKSSGWDPDVSGFVKDRASAIGDSFKEAYHQVFGGAPATPAPPTPTPDATPAKTSAGSVATDQTKWAKAIDGAGNTVERAATFTGDPADAAAAKAWFNALPMGTAFVPPGDKSGKAQYKHANFGE